MGGTVYMGGGCAREQMSDGLRRRALEEAQETRESARAERERRQRAVLLQERAIAAAVTDAGQRGEDVTPRMLRGQQVGHTPAGVHGLVSAQQDLEDRRHEARERAAFHRWRAEDISQNSFTDGDRRQLEGIQDAHAAASRLRIARFGRATRTSLMG